MRPRVLPPLPRWKGREGPRGVALLAVLWVLVGAGTAVALGLAAVRDGIATSRYRTQRTRARWEAEGCLAELRMRVERDLRRDDDAWLAPIRLAPEGCVLTAEPPAEGPVDVNTAPDSVLLGLPGFDAEVTAFVLRERTWGRRIESLDGVLGVLPADLQDRVAARYPELVGRAAFAPPAWVVSGQGLLAGRPIPVVSEWWVRAGHRVAIVRREVR